MKSTVTQQEQRSAPSTTDTNDEERSPEALEASVRALLKNPFNIDMAASELRALGYEAIEPLCRLAVWDGKRRRRLALCTFGLLLLGYIANLLIIWLVPKSAHKQSWQIIAQSISGISVFGAVRLVLSGSRAASLIARIEDFRAIGQLLEVLAAHYDPAVREALRQALEPLLRQIRANDTTMLDPHQIAALNQSAELCLAWKFGSHDEVAFVLAVFKALEQVGDETSVASIEKVLEKCKHARVREAAEDCRPYVQERARLGGRTLLRPSDAPTDDLLRPLSGGFVSNDHLLRPS